MGLLLLGASAAADRAVLADGSLLEGSFEVKPPSLVQGRKEHPLDFVLLVEAEDGRCLYAPDFESRLLAYEAIARETGRKGWNRLAADAIRLRETASAREWIARAEECGLRGPELATRLKDLKLAEEMPPSRGPATEEERAALGARAGALARALPELLAERAEREKAGGRERLRLLAAALAGDPPPAKALDLLRSEAPQAFPLGDGRAWLDWQLHLGSEGAQFVEPEQPRLAYWKRFWRKDLHGIRTGPILLFTPVRDAELLARCAAHGRLLCRVLESLFPPEPGAARDPGPLLLLLHESREEYLAQSKEHLGASDVRDLEWSSGHYAPGAGVSRFFWYKDRQAERRIAGTCMHELTHHWLEQAAPWESQRGLAPLPGFWIVEGFATFLEEGVYDVDSGRYRLFDPRAESLDTVQALGPKGLLLPWDRLLALTQHDFARLPLDPIRFQSRWKLGQSITRIRGIFYDQAAATCHYLFHAEGGKHREALLRYVRAYYGGRRADLDPSKAFGMSGQELGEQVLRFAAAVAGGWQPPPPSPGTDESR